MSWRVVGTVHAYTTSRPSHIQVINYNIIIKCIQADMITTELACTVYFTSPLSVGKSCLKYLGETTIECPVNINIVRINCRM